MGFSPWIAHTQHDYARALLSRDAAGDRERAVELINAVSGYGRLGMGSWAAAASKVDQALAGPTGDRP